MANNFPTVSDAYQGCCKAHFSTKIHYERIDDKVLVDLMRCTFEYASVDIITSRQLAFRAILPYAFAVTATITKLPKNKRRLPQISRDGPMPPGP